MVMAARLASLMERAGINANQLASRSNTSRSYISRVLAGARRRPSGEVLDKWARALGCPVDAFFAPKPSPAGDTGEAALR